jgi:membrane protease YdiL (CAAX protease family)
VAAGLAWRVRRAPSADLRAVPALVAALLLALASGVLWPLPMVLALVLVAAAARLTRDTIPPPRLGPWGRVPLVPTALVAGVTPLGLLGWHALTRPDLSDVVRTFLPPAPLIALVLGGAVFTLANATLEELVWRGVLQRGMESTLGPALAIVVQAASFGLAHAHGVPRGVAGVLLSGSWAVMLGWLRRRSGGLLAPIVAHVVADATIVALLLSLEAR